MLAGAVAGTLEHTLMFPVDTVKTRMQALAHPGQRVRCLLVPQYLASTTQYCQATSDRPTVWTYYSSFSKAPMSDTHSPYPCRMFLIRRSMELLRGVFFCSCTACQPFEPSRRCSGERASEGCMGEWQRQASEQGAVLPSSMHTRRPPICLVLSLPDCVLGQGIALTCLMGPGICSSPGTPQRAANRKHSWV